jgi:RNA polymerase sigma factor (TIGR02999 family)
MAPSQHPRPEAPPSDVTQLLLAWSGGDPSAGERLLPAVYAELHRQAARAMRRESSEHTLQATALVHEAYLRLVDQQRVVWRNRAHFFGIAAQVMRRVLVDHARERHAAKRGGGAPQLVLGEADAVSAPAAEDGVDILALHEALERLAALDPDQARLVELRYFGGLSIEETAEALGVSPATVKREWAIARAWLRRELSAS